MLKPCSACGTEVSTSATNCPKCGHPTDERAAARRRRDAKLNTVLGTVLATTGAVILLGFGPKIEGIALVILGGIGVLLGALRKR